MSIKKSDRKKYRERVVSLIKEFKRVLFLQHWTIEVVYSDKDRDNYIADCQVLSAYYASCVTFYPMHYELYKKKDVYQFEKAIIHELCHCITHPLYEEAKKQGSKVTSDYIDSMREQATEHIATIAYSSWKK